MTNTIKHINLRLQEKDDSLDWITDEILIATITIIGIISHHTSQLF